MTETPLINPLHASVIDRMDPQFAEIYTKYQAPYVRADQVTYEEYNANRAKYTFPIASGPFPEVQNITINKIPVTEPAGEISVQVYTPTEEAIQKAGSRNKDGKLPAHLNYHGGGWVIGNLKSDESWCRQACLSLSCIILNIDYRMAPDFPHPIPQKDSWAALKYAFSEADKLGIDRNRVSVGGLSAGGQIAATLAIMARDDRDMPNLVLQLLIVPAVDARWVPIEGSCDPAIVPYKSLIENEFAPCLPQQRLRWFYNLWLGTDIEKRLKAAEHWWASPIVAESHKDLAPASIHVAEIDTLASEGMAYHKKLEEAGTKSRLKVYKGVGHPFGHWDGELEKAKEFVRDTCEALREAYTIKDGITLHVKSIGN